MKHYKDMIDCIKKIKADLRSNRYSAGEELERDFYKIMELTGIKTNTLEHDDLEGVFEVQQFLINEVCKLHQKEDEAANAKLFSE